MPGIRFLHSAYVAFLSPIKLRDADKLRVLQRLDKYRRWQSLDEKRYCLICSRIITGHEIQVIGGTRGNGPLRIICATANCRSIPMDWVLPTEEVLQNNQKPVGMQDYLQPQSHSHARANPIASQLRKLAMRLNGMHK